jgi:hypothetical protein
MRSDHFASPDGVAPDGGAAYEFPELRPVNHWALAGGSTPLPAAVHPQHLPAATDHMRCAARSRCGRHTVIAFAHQIDRDCGDLQATGENVRERNRRDARLQPRRPCKKTRGPVQHPGRTQGVTLARRFARSATVCGARTRKPAGGRAMTVRTRSTTDVDLVKVAYAQNQIEAEFLQRLLRDADVGSVVRRAPGFDVPEFLAAGPQHVLVAASDVPVAQDVLREVDPSQAGPPARSGADRPSRVLAGLLIAVALVALVVCLATDVLV